MPTPEMVPDPDYITVQPELQEFGRPSESETRLLRIPRAHSPYWQFGQSASFEHKDMGCRSARRIAFLCKGLAQPLGRGLHGIGLAIVDCEHPVVIPSSTLQELGEDPGLVERDRLEQAQDVRQGHRIGGGISGGAHRGTIFGSELIC